ncbi:putative annexin repeat, Annexin superfamily [Helianthus anomalus]
MKVNFKFGNHKVRLVKFKIMSQTVVLLWMPDPAQRDAKVLIDALSTDCIDLEAVTEVRCSRTSLQLQTLKQIYHRLILLACVNKPRYEGPEVDREMAAKDAKALYKAGEKKLGSDEKVFVKIFSERSNAQLIAINTCYLDMCYKLMQGLGTNDTTLIRVIVTRTEIDMRYIKAEYHKKYHKNLNDVVHSETSGHYRTFLLSLPGPNH